MTNFSVLFLDERQSSRCKLVALHFPKAFEYVSLKLEVSWFQSFVFRPCWLKKMSSTVYEIKLALIKKRKSDGSIVHGGFHFTSDTTLVIKITIGVAIVDEGLKVKQSPLRSRNYFMRSLISPPSSSSSVSYSMF